MKPGDQVFTFVTRRLGFAGLEHVISNDPNLAALARAIRQHSQNPSTLKGNAMSDPITLPARFPIGVPVSVTFNGPTYLGGVVRGVQFTEGKVHYLITLDDGKEVIADSCDVEPAMSAAERERHALGCFTDTPGSVMCQICGSDLSAGTA